MSFFLPSSISRHSDRRDFARNVCEGLRQQTDSAIVSAQNDGSDAEIMAKPGAARWVAVRRYCSWLVVFDWRDGKTHHVTIELPDEFALA